MKEIETKCKTMAKDPTVDTILITGERGIGKSMLARTIHGLRMKASGGNGKFVTVECTSISDELFGSQLFGHVEGAFTGAIDNKVGFVETAKNGTLFFDEIGDLSPANQGKVLRLLQDREFVKVGSNENINMEAKLVVFATNCESYNLSSGIYLSSTKYGMVTKVVPKILGIFLFLTIIYPRRGVRSMQA
jgi:transcriptional regulator with PAS, ATPase and Fis domain